MMTEVKEYWCDGKPTLKDINKAFQEASPYRYIRISWFIQYSGNHSRLITWGITQVVTPEEYYEKYIPHKYSV